MDVNQIFVSAKWTRRLKSDRFHSRACHSHVTTEVIKICSTLAVVSYSHIGIGYKRDLNVAGFEVVSQLCTCQYNRVCALNMNSCTGNTQLLPSIHKVAQWYKHRERTWLHTLNSVFNSLIWSIFFRAGYIYIYIYICCVNNEVYSVFEFWTKLRQRLSELNPFLNVSCLHCMYKRNR